MAKKKSSTGDHSEIPNPAGNDLEELATVAEPKPVDEQRLGAAINNLMMSGVKAPTTASAENLVSLAKQKIESLDIFEGEV